MKKTIVLFFVVLVFISCDNDKIKPGFTKAKIQKQMPELVHNALVEQQEITQIYEAVGTIRPLTEAIIESQIAAQVVTVSCTPGTRVKKGQILISLDPSRPQTQFKQAKQGLIVAKNKLEQIYKSMDGASAGLEQAKAEYARTKKLFDSGIIASRKLEMDKAGYLQAKALLEKSQEEEKSANASIRKAEEIVNESSIALSYTKIKASSNGIIVERKIDPGDLAVPGKSLLIIQTSGALRLEANVREGLIDRITLGETYKVNIGTIDKIVLSRVEEIVPYANPDTRTFLVKVSLPEISGIYPGMFGRLLIPIKRHKTLLIPKSAITYVGQLELVHLKKEDGWESVYIKTGKTFGEKIEVLAGLTGNEIIGYK